MGCTKLHKLQTLDGRNKFLKQALNFSESNM